MCSESEMREVLASIGPAIGAFPITDFEDRNPKRKQASCTPRERQQV